MLGFRRVLAALLGLITLALVAPWAAPKAVADGDRLGCDTYCQNAGGYGGAGPRPTRYSVTVVSSGTVTADADGYVPVTLTCNLSAQCSGALLLCLENPDPTLLNMGMPGYCGRSNLLVNAGATRTIGVPLPATMLAFLRSNGPTPAVVHGDSGQTPGESTDNGNVVSGQLTVAAPG